MKDIKAIVEEIKEVGGMRDIDGSYLPDGMLAFWVEDLEDLVCRAIMNERATLTERDAEVIEAFKKAFYEHFAGAGELWFPYRGCGYTTEEDETDAVDGHWDDIIQALKQKDV